MLRISREEEEVEILSFQDQTASRNRSPVNFNVFTGGLRPCPSVADLLELDTIEEYRLENETGIYI